MSALGQYILIAESSKALITWTPTTFYIAAALFHIPLIYGIYRLTDADPTHNTVLGAVFCAVAGNATAYGLRHLGIFGVLGTIGIYLVLLVAVSGMDFFRSFVVFAALSLFYAGAVKFVVPRTPLTGATIGGYPRALAMGEVRSQSVGSLTGGTIENSETSDDSENE
ncbi:MAG: hypothetical protein ABEL76_01650 [Bradymonadaceae bacterium]